MPDSWLLALVLLTLFVTTFLRSTLGFGDALLGMPLLTLLVGIRTATPLLAFAATTISITILLGSWQRVRLKDAWRLIVACLVGIPLGLVLLMRAPEVVVKALLGVLITLFGLYNLFNPHLPAIENERWAYAFGFMAGILGGAYNVNGPPAVIYAAMRRLPPENFRATLQAFFLPTGLMILLGHGAAGLWTAQVVNLYLLALPLILGAVWLGGRMHLSIAQLGWFRQVVFVFLIIMGVLMLVSLGN